MKRINHKEDSSNSVFTEYAKENSWELHFEPEEKESDLDVSKFYSLLDEVKDYKNLNYNT